MIQLSVSHSSSETQWQKFTRGRKSAPSLGCYTEMTRSTNMFAYFTIFLSLNISGTTTNIWKWKTTFLILHEVLHDPLK